MVQLELPGGMVHEPFIRINRNHPCNEHVMRTKLLNLSHPAFDVQRRFGDERCLQQLRLFGGKMHLLELVDIAT